MKIVVCVKKVPDTETKVQVNGTSINFSGVNFVMSPYDEFAVEAAMQIKDKQEAEVIAVSLGNADCEKTLRTALAMGADKAIHLKTEYDGLGDAAAVAKLLAEQIKGLEPNIVFCGRQAIDSDQGCTGALLAHHLGLNHVSFATTCTLNGESLSIERELDGGTEKITAALPACVSTNKGPTQPRYASLKGVMAAKSKPLDVVDVSLGDSQVKVTALEMPPARAEGKIVGEGADAVPELVKLLHEEAKVI